MKIVVDVNHPAQVHFFKHFFWEMTKKGHEVLVTASKKDLTLYLLNKYGIRYCLLGEYGRSLFQKIVNVPILDIKMYNSIKHFKPDVFLGFGSVRAAHVSKMLKKPCIIFDDDEYSYPYYQYFADAICGLSGFKKVGPKTIKITSYKELAYLHPNKFQPDPTILKKFGVCPEENYCLLRFVSWNAFHDIGKSGINLDSKKKLIEQLSDYGRVFITSESPLPNQFEQYRLPIPPEFIHDFLYYANLLVCDSQTMTTEAAVLGTPAIRCNSFVGENDMGNFIELEKKYNLIFNYRGEEDTIQKAIDLLQLPDLKAGWARRRDALLKDKIDLSFFMIWFVENFPRSLYEMKKDPEIQYKFASPLLSEK